MIHMYGNNMHKNQKDIIYYFDELDSITESFYQDLFGLLSNERKEKIQKLKQKADQKESVIVYILLRLAVYEKTGYTGFLDFDRGGQNKPCLQNNIKLQFNLSHCRKCVAAALSTDEIGMDVQNIVEYTKAFQSALTDNEIQYIHQANDCNIEFTKIWALKESYGKALGCGILYPLNQFSVVKNSNLITQVNGYHMTSFLVDNYVIAVCSKHMPALKKVSYNNLKQFCLMLEQQ